MFPKYLASRYFGRHCLIAPAALALLVAFGVPARAITVTDTLDTWKMVTDHSPGLVLDDTNPTYFYNDVSRAKIGDGSTVGSFYYHFKDIASFAAFVYWFQNGGTLEVYASSDNVNWTPITYDHEDLKATTTNDATNGGWASTRVSAMLPPDTNYLAFTIHGGTAPQVWTPQIGQITMDVAKIGPDVPGPAGLSVVAAGGQAALAWYPLKSATAYTVMRRPATSKDFETLATGVTSTTFSDDGLRNGAKYYYAVTADTDGGITTDESEEVLAVPAAGAVVLADPLTDWSLTSSHTPNLKFTSVYKNVNCIQRTTATRENVEYNLPGAASFTVNVYSTDSDMNNALKVESSTDGSTWSAVASTLQLVANTVPGLYAAVCKPVSKLPSGTNFLRLVIGDDGIPEANPSIGQVRIVYAKTGAAKTTAAAAAADTVIHKAQQ